MPELRFLRLLFELLRNIETRSLEGAISSRSAPINPMRSPSTALMPLPRSAPIDRTRSAISRSITPIPFARTESAGSLTPVGSPSTALIPLRESMHGLMPVRNISTDLIPWQPSEPEQPIPLSVRGMTPNIALSLLFAINAFAISSETWNIATILSDSRYIVQSPAIDAAISRGESQIQNSENPRLSRTIAWQAAGTGLFLAPDIIQTNLPPPIDWTPPTLWGSYGIGDILTSFDILFPEALQTSALHEQFQDTELTTSIRIAAFITYATGLGTMPAAALAGTIMGYRSYQRGESMPMLLAYLGVPVVFSAARLALPEHLRSLFGAEGDGGQEQTGGEQGQDSSEQGQSDGQIPDGGGETQGAIPPSQGDDDRSQGDEGQGQGSDELSQGDDEQQQDQTPESDEDTHPISHEPEHEPANFWDRLISSIREFLTAAFSRLTLLAETIINAITHPFGGGENQIDTPAQAQGAAITEPALTAEQQILDLEPERVQATQVPQPARLAQQAEVQQPDAAIIEPTILRNRFSRLLQGRGIDEPHAIALAEGIAAGIMQKPEVHRAELVRLTHNYIGNRIGNNLGQITPAQINRADLEGLQGRGEGIVDFAVERIQSQTRQQQRQQRQ